MRSNRSRTLTATAILISLVFSAATVSVAEEPAPAAASEPDPLFDDDFELDEPPGFPDPLERLNRGTLRFNQAVDRFVLNPITEGYSFVVPSPLRLALRRFFANLDAIPTLANDALQLEVYDAATTFWRFAINSTFGLGGLFDPASAVDLPAHHSDFGQTLALSGIPSGPYLMFPMLGPTTLRDGTGAIVDAVANPLLYVLGPLTIFHAFYAGSSSLVLREEAFQELKALEDSSIDFYAALHSAFYQNRQAQIWSRREHRRSDAE